MSRTLTRFESFQYGITLPFLAAKTIFRSTTLMFWSVIPVMVTLILYFAILIQAQNALQHFLLEGFLKLGLDPSGWVTVALSIVIKFILFLAAGVSFSFVAALIACPLNDFLAEKAEAYASPKLPPAPRLQWNLKARLLLMDFMKSVAATLMGLVALLISWIPVLNFISWILTLLLVCFQYASYPQSRRGQGLFYGLQFLFRHMYACLGFGLILVVLFSIPVVSCVFLPLGVVGGTLLVARAQSTPDVPRLR